jgi:alpha-galactosidase
MFIAVWLFALPEFSYGQPVKVYILSGQSNMVGIGQVNGGGTRWGSEFVEPTLSVYDGDYDPSIDYDKREPTQVLQLESFGGVKPTPYPGGGTQVVRGFIELKTDGLYELRPGYGGSTHNIMTVNGKEVHRKEVDQKATYTPIKFTAGERVPFKITYLTNDANGLGWLARVDIPGTLSTLVKDQNKFPYLIDEEGSWLPRDDVWYKGVVTATANQWLSVGCGAGQNQIGPELGFGHILGDFHDEPVLILKASQGNRSLSWDFLPPGSERFEKDGKVYAGYKDSSPSWDADSEPKAVNWYAGKQYDDCFQAAHHVLDNFDDQFPQFAGRGFEIAGFVWWQGHKDTGNDVHAERYEENLVRLIECLRKEFKAPGAPFVVGTIGFGGWEMTGNTLKVANSQLAVGSGEKYPDLKDNVRSVETRDFWRDVDLSPRNQGFHYNQNAETYMLVGESLGKAMVELQKSANTKSEQQK